MTTTDQTRAGLALALTLPLLAYAAPGSSSPYVQDVQNTHVEDATSRGVNQVNMITRILSMDASVRVFLVNFTKRPAALTRV